MFKDICKWDLLPLTYIQWAAFAGGRRDVTDDVVTSKRPRRHVTTEAIRQSKVVVDHPDTTCKQGRPRQNIHNIAFDCHIDVDQSHCVVWIKLKSLHY